MNNSLPTARDLEEFRALRATIRERGTTRVWLLVVTMSAWGLLVVGVMAIDRLPALVLVPLVVLGVLALIPYVFPKPLDAELGRWFPKSNRLAQVVLAVIALLVLLLTILGSLPGA